MMSPSLSRGFAACFAVLFASALGLACNDNDFGLVERRQNDVFTQELRRKVDVLLVVDNSCSMIDEQQKLAANFDNFIEQFLTAEVNYQIGVTTTDMTDTEQSGRLVGDTKIITSDMSIDEARDLFQENVKVCSQGSGFERGLAAAEAALTDHVDGANAGFLREDAALSVVIVSDEDDLSAKPVGDYLTSIKGVKGAAGYRDDTLVNISAVVGDPPGGCEQPAPVIPQCTDGLDNEEGEEGDGLIDCADPDCETSRWCLFTNFGEQDCTDGIDDDGDSAVDCADADCGSENHCRESECDDGEDDDGDGAVDCRDMDCLVDQPDVCGELSCEDAGTPEALFHHGPVQVPNFWLDCADPSCFSQPDTLEQCQGGRFDTGAQNDAWGGGYKDRCEQTVEYDSASGTLDESDGLDIDDPSRLDGELAGCADPDCDTYWLCAVPNIDVEGTAECGDCIDNDNDGAEDCEDVDCLESEFCDNPYPIDPGSRYIDVALRSGGIVTSICAEEFSGLVRELGLNISGLRSIFYLSAWPVLGSIEMRYNDPSSETTVVEGWAFDPEQNRVVFDEEAIPPEGTTIHINYKRATQHPSEQSASEGSE